MVITSTVEAGPEAVKFPAYTIIPDENRAGTRLTGSASLGLGAEPRFDAEIVGGALSLPPRDATTEDAVEPYELVRLLAELPAPPVLGMPGTIGVDIAELNLRAFPVRNITFDAVSDEAGWTIKDFSGADARQQSADGRGHADRRGDASAVQRDRFAHDRSARCDRAAVAPADGRKSAVQCAGLIRRRRCAELATPWR